MSRREWRKATSYGEVAIRIDPTSAEAFRAVALAYSGMREFDRARELLAKGASLDPSDARLPGQLGDVESALERWDQAAEAYQRAIGIDPDTPLYYRLLAFALRKGGQIEAGLAVLQQASERFPGDDWLQAEKAYWFTHIGEPERAPPALQEVSRRDPESAITHHYLAMTFVILGRWREALSHAKRASELDPAVEVFGTLARGLEASEKTGIAPAVQRVDTTDSRTRHA